LRNAAPITSGRIPSGNGGTDTGHSARAGEDGAGD
jgi:hypothetical protein